MKWSHFVAQINNLGSNFRPVSNLQCDIGKYHLFFSFHSQVELNITPASQAFHNKQMETKTNHTK